MVKSQSCIDNNVRADATIPIYDVPALENMLSSSSSHSICCERVIGTSLLDYFSNCLMAPCDRHYQYNHSLSITNTLEKCLILSSAWSTFGTNTEKCRSSCLFWLVWCDELEFFALMNFFMVRLGRICEHVSWGQGYEMFSHDDVFVRLIICMVMLSFDGNVLCTI
jgi:hypothetical protein